MAHAVVDGRDTFDVIFNGEESPAEWGMAIKHEVRGCQPKVPK
jgi:hypothetical protein